MRLRWLLAGAGSVLDIWGTYPMLTFLPRRHSSAKAALQADWQKITGSSSVE
jgi:hypothetical protein